MDPNQTTDIRSPFEVYTENFGNSETAWDEFSAHVSSLPQSMQDLFLGTPAEEFVSDVSADIGLTSSQTREFSLIAAKLFLGELFIGDLVNALAEELAVGQEVAMQIRIRTINDLLAPAAEDIKKIQREKFPGRVGQGSAPIQQPGPERIMPVPPPPPQTPGGTPPVNENNIINLRDRV